MFRIGLATLVVLALAAPANSEPRALPREVDPLPLAGRVVVIDPGHQLGNANHPREISRLVDAGGFMKPCNTTGTATNGGFPEATFAFRVAKRLRARLERLGATVVMTRQRNSLDLWGPCVDRRGRWGNDRADLKLSLHGDGASAGARGFHLIVTTKRPGFRKASTSFAKVVRGTLQDAGFRRSTYIGRGTALSFRSDLGTLNLSRMPTVMAELGNMRNAKDARAMSSTRGQARYARALAKAVKSFLGEQSR